VAVHRRFDYSIPSHLKGKIERGHRLRVPWGDKVALAYAVSFPEQPEVEKCRDVLEIVDEEPLIPSALCQLAEWMAGYYCCDMAQALKGILPAVIRSKTAGHKLRLWVDVPENLDADTVLKQLAKSQRQRMAWQLAHERKGGWMAELNLITRATPATWKSLAEKGFVVIRSERMERNPFSDLVGHKLQHDLNVEQKHAVEKIIATQSSPQPILLQGVTGSGKTEVYLQALGQLLEQGKNALVLVPEISLTPQTVDQFRSRFESPSLRIAVLHSHLSDGERHDQWHQIRSGKARIVIGARSAIFAPVQNFGLIIVDEEHEPSYKQEEAPHYHARDVAVMRGKLENVPVLLGSATPSLESVYNAQQGKYLLLKLTERVDERPLPTVHIIDMKKEKASPQRAISQRLAEAVNQRIERGEQAILFLNRRGYATTVQCPSCGYVEECPNCSIALTYHRTNRTLRCHWCNYQAEVARKCPKCDFEAYRYAGMGTQRIEEIIQETFPNARWQRMDSDSMKGKHAYEQAMRDFREGKLDILVGTQMIAKGLHFPNVTCVGVIHIDHALNMPDFRAAERVFQQLVQVAGRSGRGDVPGEVFVQTYKPIDPAIQFARHHDVDGFQDQELEYRRAHDYPPYTRLALVTFRGKSEARTEFCIQQLYKRLKELLPKEASMHEPTPAPLAKIQNLYRFQLLIRTRQMATVSRTLKTHALDVTWPEDVQVSVNVDAISLL
jgi:primosomal protein N' (replication factor Y)